MANLAHFEPSAVPAMLNHYTRHDGDPEQEGYTYRNGKIDPSRTHLNYAIGQASPDLRGHMDDLIAPYKVRKNGCTLSSWVVTLPQNDRLQGREREFFAHVYDFLRERVGGENVLGGFVHMDETTPHMHFAFVPIKEKVSTTYDRTQPIIGKDGSPKLDKDGNPKFRRVPALNEDGTPKVYRSLSHSQFFTQRDLKAFHPELEAYLSDESRFGFPVGIQLDEDDTRRELSAMSQTDYIRAMESIRSAQADEASAEKAAERARSARDQLRESVREESERLESVRRGREKAQRDHARAQDEHDLAQGSAQAYDRRDEWRSKAAEIEAEGREDDPRGLGADGGDLGEGGQGERPGGVQRVLAGLRRGLAGLGRSDRERLRELGKRLFDAIDRNEAARQAHDLAKARNDAAGRDLREAAKRASDWVRANRDWAGRAQRFLERQVSQLVEAYKSSKAARTLRMATPKPPRLGRVGAPPTQEEAMRWQAIEDGEHDRARLALSIAEAERKAAEEAERERKAEEAAAQTHVNDPEPTTAVVDPVLVSSTVHAVNGSEGSRHYIAADVWDDGWVAGKVWKVTADGDLGESAVVSGELADGHMAIDGAELARNGAVLVLAEALGGGDEARRIADDAISCDDLVSGDSSEVKAIAEEEARSRWQMPVTPIEQEPEQPRRRGLRR